jgi:glutamine amidotransferase
MGNVGSVQKALNYLKIPSVITSNFDQIRSADFIILPGVGSFEKGMDNLRSSGLAELLTEEVMHNKKPFMGMCLGMQLIATTGYEPVKSPGLGWIKGEVIKIISPGKRIPHMGWNNISIQNDYYFKDIPSTDFYFIHSYHFQVAEENAVSATVDYGIPLTACVQKDNIFAAQFHPEKSQKAGLTLLKNFFQLHAQNKSYTHTDV